ALPLSFLLTPSSSVSYVLSFHRPPPSPSHLYTLSLHDALPISSVPAPDAAVVRYPLPARQFAADLAPVCGTVAGLYLLPDSAWSDRKSTRLNSSHVSISYAVFCLKKKITHLHLLITVERHAYTI